MRTNPTELNRVLPMSINERRVLLQTDHLRVVGIGITGYKVRLIIETADLDALGEVTWRKGADIDPDTTDLTGLSLKAALRRIDELERKLERLEATS